MVRLSRNARAHWYFSHLNTRVRVRNRVDLAQFTGDIEVVSVMPEEPVPADWDWDTSSLYQYKASSRYQQTGTLAFSTSTRQVTGYGTS